MAGLTIRRRSGPSVNRGTGFAQSLDLRLAWRVEHFCMPGPRAVLHSGSRTPGGLDLAGEDLSEDGVILAFKDLWRPENFRSIRSTPAVLTMQPSLCQIANRTASPRLAGKKACSLAVTRPIAVGYQTFVIARAIAKRAVWRRHRAGAARRTLHASSVDCTRPIFSVRSLRSFRGDGADALFEADLPCPTHRG